MFIECNTSIQLIKEELLDNVFCSHDNQTVDAL